MELDINKSIKVPVYQQIVDNILSGIEKGEISKNDQIPSINKIANQNKIARETVVKAFKILQEKGIIESVHGKGFFVSTNHVQTQYRVFLLLDALTPYKQKLYESIKDTFGNAAFIDVYFHHYNSDVFKKLTEEAEGNYSSYIILPIQGQQMPDVIDHLPSDRVFIIDQKPECSNTNCFGVYQDFHKDIIDVLTGLKGSILNYYKLTLVFRNTTTLVSNGLKDGFEEYCSSANINHEVVTSIYDYKPKKGESFLVIDDDDLVYLVEYANKQNWILGTDIGILSYNETSLKKVVAGGISVISTDFELMGKTIAQMILDSKSELLSNPCLIINRNSF